jgi:hypothetical protein
VGFQDLLVIGPACDRIVVGSNAVAVLEAMINQHWMFVAGPVTAKVVTCWNVVPRVFRRLLVVGCG